MDFNFLETDDDVDPALHAADTISSLEQEPA